MRKNILPSYKLVEGQPLASDFLTQATDVSYMDNVSIQIVATTSDDAGTFYVQGTADKVNWVQLNLGGTPSLSAANETHLINLNQVPFLQIRVGYDSTVSGTGTCDIIITAKQIGG